MEVAIMKLGARLPEYIARAVAGDVFAIAMLAVLGISVVGKVIKDRK